MEIYFEHKIDYQEQNIFNPKDLQFIVKLKNKPHIRFISNKKYYYGLLNKLLCDTLHFVYTNKMWEEKRKFFGFVFV